MTAIDRRGFLAWVAAMLSSCGLPKPGSDVNGSARVIVAGGGFGGLNVARSLKRLAPNLRVTLVEPRDHYIRCPGSNRVIAGLDPMDGLIHGLAGIGPRSGFDIVKDRILRVDRQPGRVVLQSGAQLPYDRLILSPGIDFRWGAIPGYDLRTSREIPHAWKGGEQTRLLFRQIASMRQGGTVIITVPQNPYRCPPGPYERASLIAHHLKSGNPRAKVLIIDDKTRFSKQPAFTEAWRRLYPGMIEWLSPESEGRVDHVEARTRVVHTEFGLHRADVLNVIPPQRAGKLARVAGVTNGDGWCPVDPLTFESTLQARIHIIGDACSASPMPKSAFSAQSQALACAAAIVAELSGKPPALPRLINHCYSFVDPRRAISITGVYGYQAAERNLALLSGGETAPEDDWLAEGAYAADWYRLMLQQTFG